jgi:ankyrin repeat protein
MASQNGHIEVVRALLDKGADVSSERDDGATALAMASQSGHPDVVQVLLGQGSKGTNRNHL